MEIDLLRIVNLLSFTDQIIRFSKNYNLFVGSNDSGKSNIFRILKSLKRFQFIDSNKDDTSSEPLLLNREYRFDESMPSSIQIRTTLSREESRILLQLIMKKDVENDRYSSELKELTFFVYWLDSPNVTDRPTLMSIHLKNDLAIVIDDNNRIFYLTFPYNKLTDFSPKEIYDQLILRSSGISNTIPDEIVANYENLKSKFIENVLNGKKIKDNELYYVDRASQIVYSSKKPTSYAAEILKYMNQNDVFFAGLQITHNVTVFDFLKMTFYKNFIFLEDIRPSLDDIATKLNEHEKGVEDAIFYIIIKNFETIFPRFSFKIYHVQNKDEKTINDSRTTFELKIINNKTGRRFSLKNSAKGYFEILNILLIISDKNRILLLDEPALHLHYSKIRVLCQIFMSTRKQIFVITHSPYFLFSEVLNANNGVFYFNKDNSKNTIITSRSSDEKISIPSYMFKPELFFSKLVILCEGPGDEAVFQAFSDRFDGFLSKNDICVTNAGGRDLLPAYYQLVESFRIKFFIMADDDHTHDYQYVKDRNCLYKLDKKLEDELNKLGFQANKKSADPIDVYNFVFDLLQNPLGRTRFKESVFGTIVNALVRELEIGNPLKKREKKQLYYLPDEDWSVD